MTEDGYTDLEREELKEASLNSLKVGTKENYLVRGCGAGVNYPRSLPPPLPLPLPLPPSAISRSSLGLIHLGILSRDSKVIYVTA